LTFTTPEQLEQFLHRLGARLTVPADLFVFGGSALLLMGGRRNTADLDYTLRSTALDACRQAIATVAAELDLDAEESVPSEFMPLPRDAETRHELLGRFGQLSVFLLDPYSIAAMKIDRAFPSDIEDVRFLIEAGKIDLDRLREHIDDIAARYDEPLALRRNFEEFRRSLSG
jgi:hypothetical protein